MKEKMPETEQIAMLNILPKKNYGGMFGAKGKNVSCYTAKQMKSLYPGGQFEKPFEYAPHSPNKRIARLSLGKSRLPLYRFGSHNRLIYREVGFVAVDGAEDSYAVLLKNALAYRAAALVLCIGLIAGSVALLTRERPDQEDTAIEALGTAAVPELEGSAVDWEGVHTQDTGGVVPGIAIPGYKSITVDADTADVMVNFQNPAENPCYFVISLLLADGTVLYQSKMIEPGKGLYEITLSEALAPGEYDAVVKYDTFSLSDLNPMNGAEVKIKLIAA